MEDSPAVKSRTVRVDVAFVCPAGQSVSPQSLSTDPVHPNRHTFHCRLHPKPPLEHAAGGEKGNKQPAASLVLLQGEDQKLPGGHPVDCCICLPGLLGLHRSLIFTPMSFCQNAAVRWLPHLSLLLQWLRVNSPGAIPECASALAPDTQEIPFKLPPRLGPQLPLQFDSWLSPAASWLLLPYT